MQPLPALRLFVFLGFALSLAGCSSAGNPSLSADDATALNKINEASGWTVRNSKLDVLAREGGAVELSLEAAATRKANVDGSIWMPVAMMSKLPDYFEATDLSTSKSIDVEAYRVPGGVWLITVVLPAPQHTALPSPTVDLSASPTTNPSSNAAVSATPKTASEVEAGTSVDSDAASGVDSPSQPSVDLKVRVVMVSPQFETGFPFLIPSGEGHAAVATTVNLPHSADFSTLQVTGADRPNQAATLTQLPASLSGNNRTAAVRLVPDAALAWDFSGVTYSSRAFGNWRPWFVPSGALLGLLAVTLWLVMGVRNLNKWSTQLHRSNRRREGKALEELRYEKDNLLTFSGLELDDKDIQLVWNRTLSNVVTVLQEQSMGYRTVEDWKEKVVKPFSRSLDEYRQKSPDHFAAQLELHLIRLERIGALLERITGRSETYGAESLYRVWRTRRLILLILLTLVFLSMIWLLSTVARAQTRVATAASKPVVTRLATLAELNVDVIPQNPVSDNYDKVNVNLSFFPLSEVSGKKSFEEIGFGVSNESRLTIDPVQLPPNSPAKLVQETGRLVRLSVPVSFAPVIQRWKVLADWKPVDFSATAEYMKNLDAASKVTVSYSIKGAQTVSSRTKGKFFHWFPYDTAEVQFPIDLRQSAIVSQINLQPPTTEYVASPTLEGLTSPFVEDDSGRAYKSISKEKDGRSAIWANKPVMLKATFQRPTWQRLLLIFGQVLLAVLVGIGVGFAMTLSERSLLKAGIELLGVFGLQFAVRSAVLARYPTLPSLLTGEGITLFEIMFFVCLVIGGVVSWYSYKKFK